MPAINTLARDNGSASTFNFNSLYRALPEAFVTILAIVFFGVYGLQAVHGVGSDWFMILRKQNSVCLPVSKDPLHCT
jgi:hypothetical protein